MKITENITKRTWYIPYSIIMALLMAGISYYSSYLVFKIPCAILSVVHIIFAVALLVKNKAIENSNSTQ